MTNQKGSTQRIKAIDRGMATGKAKELLDAVEKKYGALDIDPISPVLNAIVAFVLFLSRRYEDALDQCARALELHSDFLMARYFRSFVYHKLGHIDRAIEELDRTREIWGAGYPL
jgi:tetratricopeptide (TPR) repeat protein